MRPAGAAALLLALGLGAGCSGPAPAPPPPPAAAAGHGLAVEPAAFDFGRVLPGRALHKEFRLRNLGRQALAIESVTTDCGCMIVGDYTRQLAPGASTALTVRLQTPEQPGTLVRTLVVKTAGPQPASLQVTLSATVVAERPAGAS